MQRELNRPKQKHFQGTTRVDEILATEFLIKHHRGLRKRHGIKQLQRLPQGYDSPLCFPLTTPR